MKHQSFRQLRPSYDVNFHLKLFYFTKSTKTLRCHNIVFPASKYFRSYYMKEETLVPTILHITGIFKFSYVCSTKIVFSSSVAVINPFSIKITFFSNIRECQKLFLQCLCVCVCNLCIYVCACACAYRYIKHDVLYFTQNMAQFLQLSTGVQFFN